MADVLGWPVKYALAYGERSSWGADLPVVVPAGERWARRGDQVGAGGKAAGTGYRVIAAMLGRPRWLCRVRHE
jgi:hypothetical protein